MSNQSYLSTQEYFRVQSYRPRPARWLVDYIGFKPETLWWSKNEGYEERRENPDAWDSAIKFPHEKSWQPCPNPLVAFLRCWAAGYQQIAVQAASNTGKTYMMAGAVLHYLDTHRPSLVKTYAPTEDTLEDQLFGYMGEMLHGLNNAPGFYGIHPQADKHNDLNLYMNPNSDARDRWKASGDPVEAYSGEQAETGAESAAGAQGAHAEWMTLIIEEATGVDMSIWNALDITLSAKNQLIAYGNPDSENDPLNKFAERPSTLAIRISGFDHPNHVCGKEVIPGAFNPKQPSRMAEKFGSRDHPMWKSRVRGICPRTSGECLFKEKALKAVEEHHRLGTQEDGRLPDLPWRDPMFEIPHTPDRWRPALLSLAENHDAGEEAELSVAEKAEEEALGIYDIEGHTKIYERPKFDMVGRYVIGADVAGDYSGGDAHAAHVYDRIERHVAAEVHLRGPREAYALQILALAKAFRVPYEKDQKLIKSFEADPVPTLTERYLEAERELRKAPTEVEWPGRDQSYPKLAWETNGVGALHKISTFKGYPNKYYDKSPDIQGAKRSRRMGWQTTKGQSGSRKEMVENLRDWHHILAYEPEAVPSELLLKQMKTFKKDKSKERYQAETGEHDDHVMAQAICLTVSDRMADPVEAKTPSPSRRRTERAQLPDEGEQKSMWEGAGQSDLWSVGRT